MASREITVSVALDDTDWDALCEAADQAGMSVPDYLDWAVRLVTLHARSRRDLRPIPPVRRRGAAARIPVRIPGARRGRTPSPSACISGQNNSATTDLARRACAAKMRTSVTAA
ncbi:hypothetical protein C5E51_25140 [Nocardia nova]|uniref:hypothetical protein n=1 Tax=Nocardia nova TaxID=37330 RepID=UPI000CEA4C43|nr:hypothetical protein [Nocardia nova]PPJ04318.1 hypothetical protein C5E51_25140 [Nocardia nova]